MSTDLPEITVIIPTYNRCADLNRILNALSLQTYPFEKFEVLVVTDGCTDHTIEMLRNYRAPFGLRTIDQSNQGPAAARNNGMSLALGKDLIFLDDDVEPTPSLIEAHMGAHRCAPGGVVIGPYPPVFQGNDFLQIETRAWWGAIFRAMLQPGHRFSFSDLLSGNFSISAKLLVSYNGFDTDFRVHEDYELGMRLIKAGVPFAVAPRALAYHYEKYDLRQSCVRKRYEGRADVLMSRRHPESFDALPLKQYEGSAVLPMRIMRAFAFYLPSAGDILAAFSLQLLDVVEGARLRSQWRHLWSIVQDYWYWRGAAEELGSRQTPNVLLQQIESIMKKFHPSIEIDLGEGLESAERRLDQEKPMAARIRYGPHIIGLIPQQPGAEALRGLHLRLALASRLAAPFLEALAIEGKVTVSETIDRQRLAMAIRARSSWFGPIKPGEMWFEQYSQWNDLECKESEEQKLRKEYWNRVTDLSRETAWLEDKCSVSQGMAEKRKA